MKSAFVVSGTSIRTRRLRVGGENENEGGERGLMLEGQEHARAMNLKSNWHLKQFGQRLTHGGVLFGPGQEKEKTSIACSADFAAFGTC